MSNVFAIMTLKGRRKEEMKNTKGEKGNTRNRSEVVKREKKITKWRKGQRLRKTSLQRKRGNNKC